MTGVDFAVGRVLARVLFLGDIMSELPWVRDRRCRARRSRLLTGVSCWSSLLRSSCVSNESSVPRINFKSACALRTSELMSGG